MLTMNGFGVRKVEPLPAPRELRSDVPLSEAAASRIIGWRNDIRRIISGQDRRFLVVAGPCSIHDPEAGLEYARRLKELSGRVADRIFLVMRVYFHKPRTVIGWKGLINDPHMNGTCDIPTGLRLARSIACQVAEIGVPAATEALDNIAHQYIADVFSWNAIGARSVASSVHKELASVLSCPVGIKNGEDGSVISALNTIKAVKTPQALFGINLDTGLPEAVYTKGNQDVHLVLRGGGGCPNYADGPLHHVREDIRASEMDVRILVDCSHDNSWKDHANQHRAFKHVVNNRVNFLQEKDLIGAALESNLKPHKQTLDLSKGPKGLEYGRSVTDACIGWGETEELILEAYEELGKEQG